MLDFHIPVDCAGGHGCPDWAYEQYLLTEPVVSYDWMHVSQGYPMGGVLVIVLFQGLEYEAIYDHRHAYWLLVASYKVAFKSEVEFYRHIGK